MLPLASASGDAAADAVRTEAGAQCLRDTLHHAAARALESDALSGAVCAAPVLETLQQLHRSDPALFSAVCGGVRGGVDAAILVGVYDVEDAWLCAFASHGATMLDCAVQAVQHATAQFLDVPWTAAVSRVRRSACMARCITAAVRRAPLANHAALATAAAALGAALASMYHGVLDVEKIPQGEESLTAWPWPVPWLAAKVDTLAAADECLCLAQALDAVESVMAALRSGARAVHDAVSLVDAPLLEDLACARPVSQAILPQRTMFPSVAWRAAASLAPANAVDPELVQNIMAILPQLSHADVERRLRKPRYQSMAREQIVELFLDDPQGVGDVEEESNPLAAPPPPPEIGALDPALKTAILAQVEAEPISLPTADGAPRSEAAERILLAAYNKHGERLFARDKKARGGLERAQLRSMLASLNERHDDDVIEGWGVMLKRNPQRAAMLASAAKKDGGDEVEAEATAGAGAKAGAKVEAEAEDSR
ncbi:hypothetical protein MVES1_000249 [Malassezia vespertilionis]|uniref:CUE domain-containing protein n=1 Tax=Malassezia vespertilionis TaxID=2020962 RepID=A0A2N1JFT5_9BASI|nr:uncharacterized protein MVES1_000249 [Malassezia vespertilionis]PKI85395.1 hypothetical protein MVES_000235 [Malassezia vespertilionis]WFD04924.1 hypothetical protein MVES1_000249 [Malassezia vespertilionis]